MAKSASAKEVPEGLLLESIQDLRMATDRVFQVFSEVLLLRGSMDFARAHKGTARPIIEHCRRALLRFDRLMVHVGRILKRLRAHLAGIGLPDDARTFLDALEHILVGLTEALDTRLICKITEVRSRVTPLVDEPDRLDRVLFTGGKEAVFTIASSLVEAADQIRRQLPSDWTIAAIMRYADPVATNGKKVAAPAII